MRSREHLGESAGLGPVEPLWHGHRSSLVYERQLGLAAAPHHRHHPVPLREATGTGSERRNLSGQLEARDVRRRAGRRGITTPALKHVGTVHASSANPDQQLALARRRIGTVFDDEPLVLDRYRPHAREIYPLPRVPKETDSAALMTSFQRVR